MNRVLIAVPTFENIEPETFKSIYDLEIPEYTKTEFCFIKGYDCARARNAIVNTAFVGQFDYVLMVDSDIILPTKTLIWGLEEPTDILLGVYPRKNEPNKTELFDFRYEDFKPSSRWSMQEIKTSPYTRFKVKGGGFGCALVKTDVFRSLEYPYFNYISYPDHTFLSEDLYFCSKAADSNYEIYVDNRILCKHIGKKIVDFE